MRDVARLIGVTVVLMLPASVSAQSFALTPADLADSAAMSKSTIRLAAEVLATYRDTARTRYLDTRFRLELLTGKYKEAAATLAERRADRISRGDTTPFFRALHVQHEIFVAARLLADSTRRPLAETYAQAFRERFAQLDDRAAFLAGRIATLSPRTVASDLRWATPDQTNKTTVTLDEALTLLRVYSNVESYRAFSGLPGPLVAEDETRRYISETNVAVKTPDGATVCAIIARPRNAQGKLPALLHFTIYADSVVGMRDVLRAASNGYVGVTGHSRGKICSPDKTAPYVYDGRDAAALIDWIATQPWSNGQVGMYGGSYSGFTAWAAAKHVPKALKAIMVGSPAGPGVDVPMEGNIVWSFVYAWPFYTTNNRWLDNATYFDNARWGRMTREWYRSGRSFRELEKIDGTPNPIFADWIAHPTFDAYWRNMIPQGSEYAKITIPVLQTLGYYFGGPGAALYYYNEHRRYNPRANHYLVAGPWDHIQAQRGVITTLGDTASWFAGYVTDSAAQIDIVADLRFQWFDHWLRGGPRPALLRDKVNYQVMGANVWKHAPSLDAAANRRLRLYFAPVASSSRQALRAKPPAASASIQLTVNLADRSDIDARNGGGGILDATIDTANAITLVSDPSKTATEVTGVLSGHLEFITNKKDFDFSIRAFELMPDGQYFQLAMYSARASHVRSRMTRQLLVPGRRERLDFQGDIRMVSRRMGAGSRIVIVLGVIKNAGQQINYGTGKDVSAESIQDAGAPLGIRWLGGSYVELLTSR